MSWGPHLMNCTMCGRRMDHCVRSATGHTTWYCPNNHKVMTLAFTQNAEQN